MSKTIKIYGHSKQNKGEQMKATYIKSGLNFMPAIKYADNNVQIIYGPPLATITAAKKYAQIEINRIRGIK